MPNYKELAIMHINNYLWDLARGQVVDNPSASAIWDTSIYSASAISFIPFYPVSENLAVDSSKLPYILYDYIVLPKLNTFWPMQREEAEYIIVGDIPQIYYIKNWMVDALEKYDDSADGVNNHLLSASPTIKFKCISVSQGNYIAEEKRIDSFLPKFITTLTLNYEYTK